MFELSPEITEFVRSRLELVFRKDAAEFSDLNMLLSRNRERPRTWLIIPAMGIWSGALFLKGKSQTEQAALMEIESSVLEDLEAEHSFLSVPSEHTPADRELMLFYTKLSLGTMLLIKARKLMADKPVNAAEYAEGLLCSQRALTMIRDLSSIDSFIDYEQFPYQAKRLSNVLHSEVVKLKVLCNDFIQPLLMTDPVQHPGHYVLYATGILKEPPIGRLYLSSSDALADAVTAALDVWSRLCNSVAAGSRAKSLQDWLDLLAGIAHFASCLHADVSPRTTPSVCTHESVQYFAWLFGREIGRCIRSQTTTKDGIAELRNRISNDLMKSAWADSSLLVNERDRILDTAKCICGYLSGYRDMASVNLMKDTAVSLWKHLYRPEASQPWLSARRESFSLLHVDPNNDLYWAVHIGIGDGALGEAQEPSQHTHDAEGTAISLNLESNLSTANLDVVDSALDGTINNFSPSTGVVQRVLSELPGEIRELILSCLRPNQTTRELGHSISDLDRAVKTWLQLVLTRSLDKMAESSPDFRFVVRSDKAILPSGLSNGQWGHIFKEIAHNKPSRQYAPYRVLCEKRCHEIPGFDNTVLLKVGKALLRIGDVRNEVVHENQGSDAAKIQKHFGTVCQMAFGKRGEDGAFVLIRQLFGSIQTASPGYLDQTKNKEQQERDGNSDQSPSR